jgi:hypothetical protein
VNGEYICEFDVECWLGSCEQIVELVNLSFSGADIDHVRPNVLHPIDGFRDVAVKRLQVEIFTTKQLTTGDLTKNLGNSSEVSVHDWRKTAVHNTPVLGLQQSRLDVSLPYPVACDL